MNRWLTILFLILLIKPASATAIEDDVYAVINDFLDSSHKSRYGCNVAFRKRPISYIDLGNEFISIYKLRWYDMTNDEIDYVCNLIYSNRHEFDYTDKNGVKSKMYSNIIFTEEDTDGTTEYFDLSKLKGSIPADSLLEYNISNCGIYIQRRNPIWKLTPESWKVRRKRAPVLPAICSCSIPLFNKERSVCIFSYSYNLPMGLTDHHGTVLMKKIDNKWEIISYLYWMPG